ncbi:HD family phosphohydrolase [Mesobacillus maritimus]|uniref:HD family phosphohydrolase n=1 Tax=Mesobacillus maritimus TaxID=1643336 RepID=UPI00203C9914|nr:HD family phosphohydrolase [Mesobacillus maritimus]MCM3586291.1 HD family phosphohydrolase [Mesobacillus maritimus]MCM3671687.1 HD family phosphohydrolase [Mesobacillus maritimus]
MEKLQHSFTSILNLLKIRLFRVLLFLILGLVMFLSMYSNVKPEKLNLTLFSIADQTIRSPITVEDKVNTEKKKQDAIDQVQDVYTVKKEYTQNQVDLITSIFDTITEVHEEVNEEITQKTDEGEGEGPSSPEEVMSEKLTRVKEKLTEGVTDEVSDQSFISMINASNGDLSIAKDLTVTAVNNVMSNRIPADGVENAKKRVEEELKYTSLNSGLKKAVIELGRFAVIQNEFYDPKATEDLRQQAGDGVEPVKILEGQIIVSEGQLISRDVYHKLELAGLLDNENSLRPFVGLAMFIFIIIGTLLFIFDEMNTAENKHKQLLIFSLIFVTALLIMKLLSLFTEYELSEIGYVFPAAMGPMLIKILINERLAIFQAVILGISGSIMFNQGITGTLNVMVAIYIIASGLAGVLYLRQQNQRSKILQAGVFVSLVNLFIIIALVLLRNSQYTGLEYGINLLVAFLSGISSAVLTIGLLPFFEAGFGVLSTMKLIELSSPNHPLLRKILTEAPGTYHHSVMVANLAESACEAIGANGLLARVGCYYHDIGKTKRPQFFIENQMNIENPHDKLPPLTSKNIIIAHAIDGAEMLRKNKIPKEIVDIAEQHHGTTLLKFFYHKAKQNGDDVKEADFRYPGPKAKTKETAVIGIADSVEAAVRSMSNPTHEQIESLVKSIIADRLQDGQLSDCDITLKELNIVGESFCETLKGIFHSRIEYPEMNKQKVNKT